MNIRAMAGAMAVGMAACGAGAATIVPTTTADLPISSLAVVNSAGQITNQGNAITLRSAVIATNALAGPDVITLGAGTYQLTIAGSDNNSLGGDLDINDSLTINGVSAAATIIQMVPPPTAGDYKVIGVNQDGTHNGLTVSINNVTITGGRNNFPATGTFQETGGGVDFYMTGTGCNYSMTNCVVTGNSATGSPASYGGGVNVDSHGTATAAGPSVGMATFTNCTFSNNSSDKGGGGIALHADKHDVLLTNCTITGNHTNLIPGDGGGIAIQHSWGGTVTMNGGLVQNNTSSAGGGGMFIGYNGNTAINNVTISGNTASGTLGSNSIGGGVMIVQSGAAGISSTAALTGCTITGNHANGTAGGTGGGVYFSSAYPATIGKCTITGNSAFASGGGIAVGAGSSAALTANFNRIVGNTSPASIGMVAATATNAENNWWGANTAAGVTAVATGTVDSNPWIKLGLTSGAASVVLGGTTGLTADMSKNSDNVTIASTNLGALAGTPVAFGATLGTISGAQASIQSTGTATATFNAGSTSGAGSASATVDGVAVNVPITLTCPTLTATVSGGGIMCAGAGSTVSVTISSGQAPFTVTLNNGGGTQMGSSPLVFNVSPGATTTYSMTSGTDARGCALTGSGSATVTFVGTPSTPTGPSATQTIVCPGGTSMLSATVPAGQTVEWHTGSCTGTLVSGGATPTVMPAATTTYYARARTNSGGCLSTACASVTVRVCAADFNCSGAINVQDIFDYLAAWFAGAAGADFNHVNGINVQDIFDFLAAWFAPCL